MRDVSGLDRIRDELETFGATERAGKMREDRLRRFVCAERRNDDDKVRIEIRVDGNRGRPNGT